MTRRRIAIFAAYPAAGILGTYFWEDVLSFARMIVVRFGVEGLLVMIAMLCFAFIIPSLTKDPITDPHRPPLEH